MVFTIMWIVSFLTCYNSAGCIWWPKRSFHFCVFGVATSVIRWWFLCIVSFDLFMRLVFKANVSVIIESLDLLEHWFVSYGTACTNDCVIIMNEILAVMILGQCIWSKLGTCCDTLPSNLKHHFIYIFFQILQAI